MGSLGGASARRYEQKSSEIGCRRADLDRNQTVAPPPQPRRRQIDHPPNANPLPHANALRDLPEGVAAAFNEWSCLRLHKNSGLFLILMDKEIGDAAPPSYHTPPLYPTIPPPH